MDIKSYLNEISLELKQNIQLPISTKLYLTGSYASKRQGKNSDIDLVCIDENDCVPRHRIINIIRDNNKIQILIIPNKYFSESYLSSKNFFETRNNHNDNIPCLLNDVADETSHFIFIRFLMGIDTETNIPNYVCRTHHQFYNYILFHQACHLFNSGNNAKLDIDGLKTTKDYRTLGFRTMEMSVVFLWSCLAADKHMIDRKKWIFWAINHYNYTKIKSNLFESAIFNIAKNKNEFIKQQKAAKKIELKAQESIEITYEKLKKMKV